MTGSKGQIGSDHRLIRCKTSFNIGKERKKLITKKRVLDLEKLDERKNIFELELKNRFDVLEVEECVESLYDNICEVIDTKAQKVAGYKQKGNIDKLCQQTKCLLAKRREMTANEENHNTLEYKDLCRTVRIQMKKDIRKYNTERVKQELEKGGSVKKARRYIYIGKNQIIQIKEEDGTIISDRDRIIKRTE